MTRLLFSLTMVLAALSFARGAENSPTKAAKSKQDGAVSPAPKSQTAQKKYMVFAGTNCTRTFRKVDSFDTVQEAMRAVREDKSFDTLWIATGNEKQAQGLMPNFRKYLKVTGCSVYVFSPSSGCRLHAETATVREAEEAVAQIDRDVCTPAIVFHLK